MRDTNAEEFSDLTEVEWESAADWDRMLNLVCKRAGTRKMLLLSVALCRRIWDLLPYDDCRQAVEAVEQLADHPDVAGEDYSIASEADALLTRLQEGYIRVHEAEASPRGAYLAALTCSGIWHDTDGLIENTATAAAIAAAHDAEGPAWEAERRAQARLLQELFGNPFRPIAMDRAWLTPNIVETTRAIYEERAFGRLPTLADSLHRAGCDNATILAHCRDASPHVRGCWVVDLLLGKG